jgi:hypothetical protein
LGDDGGEHRSGSEELATFVDGVEIPRDFGSTVDLITTDKGWSIEYVLELTWRQVYALVERYWHRRSLEMALAARMNPFYSPEGASAEGQPASSGPTVDATSMDTVQDLMMQGFPVKIVPTPK